MLKKLFNFAILSTAILSNNSFSSNSTNEISDELSSSIATHATFPLDDLPNEITLNILGFLDSEELSETRVTCHKLKKLSEEAQKINNKKDLFLSIKNNTGASIELELVIGLDSKMIYSGCRVTSIPPTILDTRISKYKTLEDGEILSLNQKNIDKMVKQSADYRNKLYISPRNKVFTATELRTIHIYGNIDYKFTSDQSFLLNKKREVSRIISSIEDLKSLDIKKSVRKPFELIGSKKDGFQLQVKE